MPDTGLTHAGKATGGGDNGASTSASAGCQANAQKDPEDDDDAESSSGDDDNYVSDSDSDGEGMHKLLQLLESDKDVDPATLVVSGKRQRSQVDYRKLNDEMFGDVECYEGEGTDDDFSCQAPRAPRARPAKQRSAKQRPAKQRRR